MRNCGHVQTRPGSEDFFRVRVYLCLSPARFTFRFESKYSEAEVNMQKLLVFEALMDKNEQKESILYRFFSPGNQL